MATTRRQLQTRLPERLIDAVKASAAAKGSTATDWTINAIVAALRQQWGAAEVAKLLPKDPAIDR